MTTIDESAARAEELPRRRWVRPSTPEDATAIAAVMSGAGLRSNTEPQHLHWKYWQERPEWTGSRSYVLTDGKEVLAHGAIIPATRVGGGGRLRMAHLIDWAARSSEFGAGVALLKYVGRLTDALYGIGGSADTMRILPQIGFRTCATVTGYVRPLSPRNLWREAGGAGLRIAPRVARSTLWILTASRSSLRGWSARLLSAGEIDRLAPVLPQPRRGFTVIERGEALFRYVLTCPIVPMALYGLEYDRRLRGYFLLAFAPGQTRLADAWVDSDDLSDWRALVGCAVREARYRGGAAELATWASEPLLMRALADNGFHRRFSLPLMLRAGAQASSDPAPRIQMLDNDALYLCEGRSQLWA